MEEKEKTSRWRWGVHRWFVLLFIVLGFFAAQSYPPVQPHIALPAERLTHNPVTLPIIGDFYLTNTILATLIADVLIILLAFAYRRSTRGGNLIPRGISGAVEGLLEGLYNLTESTAGKWAKTIFPYFATITLLVLVVNWMELIPGVDSIGLLEPVGEGEHGFPIEDAFGFNTIVNAPEGDAEHHEKQYLLSPFVRVASTDLNFTISLALIAVVMTQVIGVRALKGGYFRKFINTKTLFKVPMFGVIDFGVGLLELVSEISKVLSFSFRLFGNIFAGSVLLFVIGTLVPVAAQSGFLLLEFGVGMIQAIVFGMLTMTFMAQATISHDDEHHD
ncbi:MAG: F0F1 ATP synthase subunit A [Chloroflexi bacterium]|nr:F0F1 ATP synthase subunit A [Chloroflexota bacterium]